MVKLASSKHPKPYIRSLAFHHHHPLLRLKANLAFQFLTTETKKQNLATASTIELNRVKEISKNGLKLVNCD